MTYTEFLLAELATSTADLHEATELKAVEHITEYVLEIRALALMLNEIDTIQLPVKRKLVNQTVRVMERTKHRWDEYRRYN